jgi:hypothetical protein
MTNIYGWPINWRYNKDINQWYMNLYGNSTQAISGLLHSVKSKLT